MSIVDNHPATKYPSTEAMALEARNAVVSRAVNLAIQRTALEEFLEEDASFRETIDNLEQLLNHIQQAPINVSPVVLIDLRMAFKALTNINKVMEAPV